MATRSREENGLRRERAQDQKREGKKNNEKKRKRNEKNKIFLLV